MEGLGEVSAFSCSAVEVCTVKAFVCLCEMSFLQRKSLIVLYFKHFRKNAINHSIFFLFLCVSFSYVVNMGLIDRLYGCFLSVQSPVDEHPKMSAFLQQASALLHSMCKLCFVVTGR